ncbi:MAG: hypothetical protein KatS3mg038_0995 [Candidatus Kapaibacterium sp.]|nr:MAG: hypothetical protein KatS3mg038_0995 [Candidatus Kapabacteria bacterium]
MWGKYDAAVMDAEGNLDRLDASLLPRRSEYHSAVALPDRFVLRVTHQQPRSINYLIYWTPGDGTARFMPYRFAQAVYPLPNGLVAG